MRNAMLGRCAAMSLCAVLALGGVAAGQAVDVKGDTAGSTARTLSGTTKNGDNPTAGKAFPERRPGGNQGHRHPISQPAALSKAARYSAKNTLPAVGDESGIAPRANTKHAGPAARTAEATAHKTVEDPNNELGTSLKGATIAPPAETRQGP